MYSKEITYFYEVNICKLDMNICKHGYYVLTHHGTIWHCIWLALHDLVKNNDLKEIRE